MLCGRHAAAKNALADIQEKHQDILRLEAVSAPSWFTKRWEIPVILPEVYVSSRSSTPVENHAQFRLILFLISQSINELYQLFSDMAVLVETQGELLNNIEYNVQQASAYTAKVRTFCGL